MNREQLTPKFRGIYDKAMTGRSLKSAIQVGCLICTTCKTKEIKNCSDSGCQNYPYRPYQKIPWKSRRGNPQQILNRVHKGKIARKSISTPRSVTKDILIPNPHTERLRVRIVVEPEK